MRTPPPLRSGSRTRSCGASGGGKAPVSGGSVRRAGASFATVTGRQSAAVDAVPFTMRRMSRSAWSSRSLRAAIPVSVNTAASASSSASWRAHNPSSARWGHCASPAAGSQSLSFLRSPLRSRSRRSRGSTDGRVQQATTRVSATMSGASLRARSASRSSRSSPRRPACLPTACPCPTASVCASSGARSKTTWSAWPGWAKAVLRRSAATSTKRSSSSVPIIERDPSSASSETSEPSWQTRTPPPPSSGTAAWGARKLSSGLRRRVQLRRCRSSAAAARERGMTRASLQPPAPTASA